MVGGGKDAARSRILTHGDESAMIFGERSGLNKNGHFREFSAQSSPVIDVLDPGGFELLPVSQGGASGRGPDRDTHRQLLRSYGGKDQAQGIRAGRVPFAEPRPLVLLNLILTKI